MRNLLNTKHMRLKFDKQHLTATAWDATDDSSVFTFGPTEADPTITLRRLPSDAIDSESTISIASWDAPSPLPDLPVDRILDLHCFPETRTICLLLAGGDLVVVREDAQPGEDAIEIVGSVDNGIKAAAWSPDEEVLALLTGAGTLLFMTRDFESLANVSLTPEDVKISNHVSVGWGKKETQFKGRGVAKQLRDPTVPEHVDEGTVDTFDNGRVSITWRNDGQYLVVNSILDEEPRRRILRVYTREGTLESVSEPVNGLTDALSWKPSGQLIASVQRSSEQVNVVFFERNGLRHGEFALRLEKEEITTMGQSADLDWNTDSTVLAVKMQHKVQLWTVGNYHYYLKQEIRLDTTEGQTRVQWHPEKPLHLCVSNGEELHHLAYRFEVARGPMLPPHDAGMVAVIDGRNLKVTPLRTANVPPPMAFDEVSLPENALDVAINESGTEIAVLHDKAVSFWTCDYVSKPPVRASLSKLLTLARDADRTMNVDSSSTESYRVLNPGFGNLYARTDHDRIAYQKTTPDAEELRRGPTVATVDAADPFKVAWRSSGGTEISFQHIETGLLQVASPNQQLRITSCTSFIVTETHLVYTTGQHLLKFIHLHEGNLEVPADEPEKDERCRAIERGAKIVTVMPSAYSLVLQMPRGNLETIYPRALVLAGVRQSLKARDYKTAFVICRAHRVDMNILYDYIPEQFMRDVATFVKQVKKTEHLDLFLSSLSEENVSETMYRETLAPTEAPVLSGTVNGDSALLSSTSTSKVNRICDAFLQELEHHSLTRLQNIVTAHVCKNPPDLEGGLRLVSKLRAEGQEERLEQAVEHICFLADVNKLYDTALGIYDLDVALLVAQQSQKDPREYLPHLQSLHDMETTRQRFTIDDELKRTSKALGHLHALDAFDELMAYTVKHTLYSEAIQLYRYDNSRSQELMRVYADHLNNRNKFREAGIAYEYVSDHSSAYQAYRAANMWRECLASAALVPVSPDELVALARDLAGSLEESKDFADAATIHLEYLGDLEGGATLLCKGFHFAAAIREVVLRQRTELLSSIINVSLAEASGTMTELLAEMKSQLSAQVPRLRELRQKKAEDPMAFLDGADGGDANIPDDISLAPTDASTSGMTFMTRYTNNSMGTLATNATRKTSKNRRREERKRARGKKGTVYEEEYLVNSIARLIERLNEVCSDSAKLVEGLMRRAMRERAMAVQSATEEVVAACRQCMEEVFSPTDQANAIQSHLSTAEVEPTRPLGGQGVLWDALKSSNNQTPVLKPYRRLDLLP